MKINCLRYYLSLLFTTWAIHQTAFVQTTERPNILFIISDDLNDHIEGYNGHINTSTPNLDLLRDQGTVFLNAYASAPICAPSRTSFLTGKDLLYTQVYKNTDGDYKCKEFGDNFTPAEGNEVYFTIPQYFKDSLGYYTFNLNKVFHCHKNYIEFDEETPDPCAKSGAWNRYLYYNDSSIIQPAGVALDQGVNGYDWAAIDDSLEKYMSDYVATDSAVDFIHQYATSPESACNKPFLMMMGYQKPHKEQFIPNKYFLPDYVRDFYAAPFDVPYNYPKNTYPPNGIALPPQPDTPFADLDALLINSISPLMVKNVDTHFMNWPEELPTLPEIDASFTDEERIDMLVWSKRANAVMAYLAAVRFVDEQFGRLYNALVEEPELLHNTIIVFIGDNGYSLSEKRHWGKYALWDTDVRIPLIIADMRNPQAQVCNRTVSLLDLFPTLLELSEGTMPTFPDGSRYVDGASIVPLLINPDTIWTRPVISATKKQESNDIGDCFPHYSVRDERFHLLTYRTNGAIPMSCDSASSTLEYELYDIGYQRETDPFEWHNLAYDPDYAPVIEYMNQWLPNEPLYGKKTLTVDIQHDAVTCLVSYGESMHLDLDIFDTLGAAISIPDGYVCRWTNNMSDDTLTGVELEFSTDLIPFDIFAAGSKLMIYAEVVDTAQQVMAAFDMETFQINDFSTPFISFSLLQYGANAILVNDFAISGTYSGYTWDFGFGPVFHNEIPGPVYFDDISSVTVTCTATYGNENACDVVAAETFIESNTQNTYSGSLHIFPNPADNIIHVFSDAALTGNTYVIYDALGNMVKEVAGSGNTIVDQIDVTGWPAGMYHIVVGENLRIFTGSFIIVH